MCQRPPHQAPFSVLVSFFFLFRKGPTSFDAFHSFPKITGPPLFSKSRGLIQKHEVCMLQHGHGQREPHPHFRVAYADWILDLTVLLAWGQFKVGSVEGCPKKQLSDCCRSAAHLRRLKNLNRKFWFSCVLQKRRGGGRLDWKSLREGWRTTKESKRSGRREASSPVFQLCNFCHVPSWWLRFPVD